MRLKVTLQPKCRASIPEILNVSKCSGSPSRIIDMRFWSMRHKSSPARIKPDRSGRPLDGMPADNASRCWRPGRWFRNSLIAARHGGMQPLTIWA